MCGMRPRSHKPVTISLIQKLKADGPREGYERADFGHKLSSDRDRESPPTGQRERAGTPAAAWRPRRGRLLKSACLLTRRSGEQNRTT